MNGVKFVVLKAVIHRAKMELGKIRDGFVIPFNMPAIVELGTATGFDFELIDRAGLWRRR